MWHPTVYGCETAALDNWTVITYKYNWQWDRRIHHHCFWLLLECHSQYKDTCSPWFRRAKTATDGWMDGWSCKVQVSLVDVVAYYYVAKREMLPFHSEECNSRWTRSMVMVMMERRCIEMGCSRYKAVLRMVSRNCMADLFVVINRGS